MQLTTFTDYSLRVLMYLAARPGQRATAAQVADAFGISQHHVVKVVHFLGKAGWLDNVRGKGGGLALARPASRINIADVVRDAEGEARLAACFDDRTAEGECPLTPVCKLRGVLGDALAAFHAVLARYTLEDVVRNREEVAAILFMPQPRREPLRKVA